MTSGPRNPDLSAGGQRKLALISSSPQLCSGEKPDEMHLSASWLCAIKTLRVVVSNNLEHFNRTIAVQDRQNRFLKCFSLLNDHINAIQPMIEKINHHSSRFDFGKVPANGFRSLLSVTDACLCHLVGTSRVIESQRDAFLFRKNVHLKDLEEYTKVLGGLRKMLSFAQKMMEQSDSGSVFPKDGSKLIDEWFKEIETLNQEVFYGRSLGFQYCSSVHTTLQTIALAMAVCSETYRTLERRKPGSGKITTLPNMFSTTRYIINPELRAKQIVHTTRNADINFCKQFWGLTEASYLQSGFNWILPSVAVNKVLTLEPKIVNVRSKDGADVAVRSPSYDRPIFARYINDRKSESDDLEKVPLSPYLLFHCHGGGFIAQSSKSHEVYLLKWAKDLQIPILSVDYALAPEDPYPKGLDEVVYTYAWALQNAQQLGWTGEKVCFVGDSAGGNLVVGAALKIACKNIKIPDGILAAYGAFLVQYTPSPSRLLCLMDPLLPMGILTRCLAAYAGIPEPTSVGQVQGADDKMSSDMAPVSPSSYTALGDAPGNLTSTSSSSANLAELYPSTDSALGESLSATDGSQSQDFTSEKPVNRWFGKGMANLFNILKAKPMEIINEDTPADPEAPVSEEEKRKLRGIDAVEPLPRFNFAAVSVEDPFLSPLLAEDNILAGLPPVYLVACHLDPLLDDSISALHCLGHGLNHENCEIDIFPAGFARRLEQLKKPVHLDVINHLPHGFLNLSMLSAEAAKATDLCAKRIRQILKMDDR